MNQDGYEEDCGNCNGTGYVREGYDGEAPCEFCRPDDFVSWLREEARQSENSYQASKARNEKLTAEIDKLQANLAKLWQENDQRKAELAYAQPELEHLRKALKRLREIDDEYIMLLSNVLKTKGPDLPYTDLSSGLQKFQASRDALEKK